VDIRPATEADGAGIAAVRNAIGGQHDDSGSDAGYRAHLLAHGRLAVAVGDRDGRIVGFGGARDVGGRRLLSDLFVDPAVQGSGVGRALLDAVLDGAPERFTFSSSDPRAMPIYARAGMRPRWPLVQVRGPVPAATQRPAGIAVEATDADAATAVEQALTGVDRAVEHRYWAGRNGAVAGVVHVRGEVVGAASYVVRGAVCRIDHLVVAEAVGAGPVVVAIGAAAGVSTLVACIPGPHPVLEWLLHRRFAVSDSDTFMASDPDAVPAQVAVVHPGLC
jgi:GNAT superfamily N-acetyltransferase